MNRKRSLLKNEKGMVLVYMAGAITVLLLFSGLSVDTGRAYVVKAQLSKALDGAALGAARDMNSGNPTQEATRIFNANFPPGYMGSTLASGPTVSLSTDAATGRNVVSITASATVPTTFMRLGNITTGGREQLRGGHAQDGRPVAHPGRVRLHRIQVAGGP